MYKKKYPYLFMKFYYWLTFENQKLSGLPNKYNGQKIF